MCVKHEIFTQQIILKASIGSIGFLFVPVDGQDSIDRKSTIRAVHSVVLCQTNVMFTKPNVELIMFADNQLRCS